MADPLSIVDGCIGVLTAAAQISSLLIKFTKHTMNAPQLARLVLIEVSDISGILSQLQSFLLRTNSVASSRIAMLQADQVVTIISRCVLTISELQELVNDIKVESMGVINRMQWGKKETIMIPLIQRLQTHKASLSLMLGILNGNTIIEAKDSVDRLYILVEKYYHEMSQRLPVLQESGQVDQDQHSDDKPVSASAFAKAPRFRVPGTAHGLRIRSSFSSEHPFTKDLEKSRVYGRVPDWRNSEVSFRTGVHSTSWSILSGLSLADISIISIISLLITSEELYGPSPYLQSPSIDGAMSIELTQTTGDNLAQTAFESNHKLHTESTLHDRSRNLRPETEADEEKPVRDPRRLSPTSLSNSGLLPPEQKEMARILPDQLSSGTFRDLSTAVHLTTLLNPRNIRM